MISFRPPCSVCHSVWDRSFVTACVVASALHFSPQVVFAFLWQVLLLGVYPSLWSCLGALMITASAVAIGINKWRIQQRLNQQPPPQTSPAEPSPTSPPSASYVSFDTQQHGGEGSDERATEGDAQNETRNDRNGKEWEGERETEMENTLGKTEIRG